MSIYIASLDLGQINDYAALVITEASGTIQKYYVDEPHPEVKVMHTVTKSVETMPLTHINVVHAERFPLGTKYAVVAHEMRKRIEGIPRNARRYFCLDQTGVGQGAVEFFTYLSPLGIVFTAGNAERAEQDGFGNWTFHVPKRNLIGAAQVLLQNRIMKIAADLPFADVLAKELTSFKMKISLAGHDTYEAWRERDHDDLVNALAMACWTTNTVIGVSVINQLSERKWEDPPGISPY